MCVYNISRKTIVLESGIKNSLNRLQSIVTNWSEILIKFFVLVVALRFLFMLEIEVRVGYGESLLHTMLYGLLYDIVVVSKICVLILLPIAIFQFFSRKVGSIVFSVIIIIYVILSAIVAEYFCQVGQPLDHVVWAYTPQEIYSTVLWSTKISIGPIIFFICYLFMGIGCLLLPIRRSKGILLSWAYILTALILFSCVRYKKLIEKEYFFDTHADFIKGVNQVSYACMKIVGYKISEKKHGVSAVEVGAITSKYHIHTPEFSFISDTYPFMRENNDIDVLGSLMRRTNQNTKPNFVFIIVESMGQSLTGVPKPTISFMPFVDSLKKQSLYWPNCLSTTERTFGVMPAVFASVPHGKKGFGNEQLPIPEYNSLLKDMARNEYTISFFYGGAPSFGGQNAFMKANNVSYISEIKLDTANTEMYQLQKKNYRWGADDRDMFLFAEEYKNQHTKQPFVDIYLTLSSHEPFVVPDIDKYETKIKNTHNLDPASIEGDNILSHINIYASFMYVDDCLRQVFSYYKTREDFNNTIFILTGDHRMGPVTTEQNPLRKYNVPLIIYSPLLKRPQTMEPIVSHYDIPPTINTYLQNNYTYKTASTCHWLGSSLDTAKNFRRKKTQAFMLNNSDVVEYLHDTLFISRGRLYTVQKGLVLHKIESDTLANYMQSLLDEYQKLSEYSLYNNKLQSTNLHK